MSDWCVQWHVVGARQMDRLGPVLGQWSGLSAVFPVHVPPSQYLSLAGESGSSHHLGIGVALIIGSAVTAAAKAPGGATVTCTAADGRSPGRPRARIWWGPTMHASCTGVWGAHLVGFRPSPPAYLVRCCEQKRSARRSSLKGNSASTANPPPAIGPTKRAA
jgi:hypothetical protein